MLVNMHIFLELVRLDQDMSCVKMPVNRLGYVQTWATWNVTRSMYSTRHLHRWGQISSRPWEMYSFMFLRQWGRDSEMAGWCGLVKCVIWGKCMGNDAREDLIHNTVATSQNGWAEVWKKSRGMALEGYNWCEVLHGRLIVIRKRKGVIKLVQCMQDFKSGWRF